MNNKLIRLMVALSVLVLPALVQAQFTITTNNGTITITGYSGSGGAVTIPTNINGLTVNSIGDSAFQDTSLTSVTIPDSVTNIAFGAFIDCIYLTSVTIGNGVTCIGDYAFADNVLTSVTIPNSVTSIGEEAFGYGTSLTSINVDAANPAYSSLGGVLFDKAQATLLEFPGGLGGSYTISNGVTSIGDEAFEDCIYLTSVTIGNSVTSIGDEAFESCSGLTSLTIGNGVTSIGDSAFSGCSDLTSVTMGNIVTSIGDEAFVYCSGLTSISIPYSVTSIGENAFYGCSGLTSVTIGYSVTSIGEGAFYDCSSLTSVTILNSVTSIGSYAFADCTSLTKVYFTGNAPSPNNDSTVFYGFFAGAPDAATVYYLPGTTGWGAMFDGQPTAPWFLPNPLILNGEPSFGVQPGGFGFTISWATNASVVVQAATNLANPVWIPVSTNTLTGGTNYFSDTQWTNYPGRFYRISSP
jgi:hypothetical protein